MLLWWSGECNWWVLKCNMLFGLWMRRSLTSLSSCLSIRDLQRLGELQPELTGSADFCATYLRCQLLLMKVCVILSITLLLIIVHLARVMLFILVWEGWSCFQNKNAGGLKITALRNSGLSVRIFMFYLCLVLSGSAGEAVEHGRPSLPQTERHGHSSSSTGLHTHVAVCKPVKWFGAFICLNARDCVCRS